jgi:TRAP-type C4-dicarboxylate transport system permease small subunit
MAAVARILSTLSTLALWLAGTGLVAMTASVSWLVFGRYVLNDSPTWVEPMALILMSWFIFLGAAVGVRENTHLGFEVLQALVPPRLGAFFRSVSDLVVVTFGAGMAFFGTHLMTGTWSATLPSLGLPRGVGFIPIVAGGVLFVLFGLERLARRAAGLETDAPHLRPATGAEEGG